MDLSDFDTRGGEWLRGGGERSDVVISTRIRLARNLAGHHFLGRARPDERHEIVERVRPVLRNLPLGRPVFYRPMEDADPVEARFLVERHLISRELESGSGPRGVAFGSDEVVSVMVNEEDHLRIQVIQASFSIANCFREALRIDQLIEDEVDYAVSDDFGYLTACPTNVGTGLRASVMLHLPALVQMKQIQRIFQSATKTGFTVRGTYGEGTQASGDLYQISNQVTLGKPEEEILQNLQHMIPHILQYEDRCREELQTRLKTQLEDRCHRALATLRAARLLTSDEAMANLSAVRLGVVLGVLQGVDVSRINEMFVLIKPGHLQKLEGRAIDAEERDIRRANFVRACLS